MKDARTSDSHPINVDFIENDPEWFFKGKIGLTFAPGKKQLFASSGSWNRDLDKDLKRLRDVYQTRHLVTLIEDHEFEQLQIKDLLGRAATLDINTVWFPIIDQGVPDSNEKLKSLIDKINDFLNAGETVVIHCMGGLGRSGLVAACCLLSATNMYPNEAIRIVRQARSGAVENVHQEHFIIKYKDYLSQKS